MISKKKEINGEEVKWWEEKRTRNKFEATM